MFLDFLNLWFGSPNSMSEEMDHSARWFAARFVHQRWDEPGQGMQSVPLCAIENYEWGFAFRISA